MRDVIGEKCFPNECVNHYFFDLAVLLSPQRMIFFLVFLLLHTTTMVGVAHSNRKVAFREEKTISYKNSPEKILEGDQIKPLLSS